MKHNAKRCLAAILCVLMFVSMLPMTALALTFDTTVSGGYFNVLSKKEYTLVPGATEIEIVVNNADGTDRKFVHVMEVDTKNPAVSIVPGYNMIDKFATDPANVSNQTAAKVTDMAAYYEKTLGYNVVGAMNTSLAYDSNAPYSFLMYEGVVLQDKNHTYKKIGTVINEETGETFNPEWKLADAFYNEDGTVNEAAVNQHTGSCQTYLAIKKDGTCELRGGTETFEADDYTVISANFGWCVKDGVNTITTAERTTSDASRSMLGIKEDGTLVICQVDGRNANNSTGLSNYELGEMMLSLGCQWAVNGDGGGSSTFITQREGEEDLTMRSSPSDGAERPTIHAIMVVSNLNPTGVLKEVSVTSDYDYFTPYSQPVFDAVGVDTGSFTMDIPADAVWTLSDDSFGTIANGKFISNGKLGTVDIQVEYNNEVVGSKTITVVNPDVNKFTFDSTVIPYTTAEKVRTITLPFTLQYGADNADVYYDVHTFDIALSDDKAATLNGIELTATSDTSIAGVVVTATYNADTSIVLTLNVEYGKGSEVIWNFEDADASDWLGIEDGQQWLEDNGITNSPFLGSDPLAGQYSPNNDSNTFLATAENGKVHNGNYALGVNLDYTHDDFAGWSYNMFCYVGEQKVLRDVANGMKATTLGMWIYVPEGAAGLALQTQLIQGNSATETSFFGANVMIHSLNGVKTLNSCTEADIPEDRWVYGTVDISGYNYVATQDPTATTASASSKRAPTFIRHYIKTTTAAKWVFYYDDITLDYSAAVDDRDAPIISDASYVPNDVNVSFDTATTSTSMSFTATVKDYEANNMGGLDYASAKIYLDGVALNNVTASGNTLATKTAVAVAPGVHKVKFEIADTLGNVTTLTKTLTVSGDATVTLGGHNDGNNTPEYDSVYYVDINVADISKISSVTMSVKLNTANNWILDQMIPAKGFKAVYTFNQYANTATITVTNDGNNTSTGAATLLSIPVRVWSWNEAATGVTPEAQFKSAYCPIVSIDYSVMGTTVYTDGTSDSFSGEKSVATMLNDNVNPWHYHTEEAIADLEATCTEDGYTGRTYCDVCQSVVDFGTKEEATGHNIGVVDGKLACTTCNEVHKYTGLYELNGKTYYAIGGNLQTKWHQVDGEWYYFHYLDFYGFDGTFNIKAYFSFDIKGSYTFEDGKLVSGVWSKTDEGMRYYYGPSYYFRGWRTIDGNDYYFDANGYCYTGYKSIRLNPNDPNSIYQMFLFDENGVSQGLVTGIVNGTYFKDGVGYAAGLIVIDDSLYYVKAGGWVVTNGTRYVSDAEISDEARALGYKAGNYTFDAEGKFEIKNGVYPLNGYYYYYENGQLTNAGLIVIDDCLYYVKAGGWVVTNGTRYVSDAEISDEARALGFKAGNYTFDAEGKFEIKNGVYPLNGYYYYYENGQLTNAGLIVIDDCLYYVKAGGWVVTNGTRYVSDAEISDEARALGFKAGNYTFDAEGKFEIKNGVYQLNGYYYYYENGKLTNAGLIIIGTDLYYVKAGGWVVTNGTRYVSDAEISDEVRALGFKAGNYTFDAEGKFELKHGVYQVNGYYYYYEYGKLVNAGLTVVGDDVYYVKAGGWVVTNGARYVSDAEISDSARALGFEAGTYTFDATGKLVK